MLLSIPNRTKNGQKAALWTLEPTDGRRFSQSRMGLTVDGNHPEVELYSTTTLNQQKMVACQSA